MNEAENLLLKVIDIEKKNNGESNTALAIYYRNLGDVNRE